LIRGERGVDGERLYSKGDGKTQIFGRELVGKTELLRFRET
jgi:hypothetical protein